MKYGAVRKFSSGSHCILPHSLILHYACRSLLMTKTMQQLSGCALILLFSGGEIKDYNFIGDLVSKETVCYVGGFTVTKG